MTNPGHNMKAREPFGRKRVVQTSAVEGQPESIIEPVLERLERSETPDTLEPENEGVLESPKGLDVAGSEPVEEAVQGPGADLEKALKESQESHDAEIVKDVLKQVGPYGNQANIYLGVEPLVVKAQLATTIAEFEEVMHRGGNIELRPNGTVIIQEGLGQRPDGSY